MLKQKLASRKEAKKEEVAPNVTVRPQRQSFEDQSPSSGTSLFEDDKATSIPVRPKLSVGFADMLHEKRVEKEDGRNAVEAQNDLLQSATKSSSKATPPRHSDTNQKTPNQDGRPMRNPHSFPLEMPFDLSVVDFGHKSPPRNPKTQRKGTHVDPATNISSKTGRPVGSTNKMPKPNSIHGMEFG